MPKLTQLVQAIIEENERHVATLDELWAEVPASFRQRRDDRNLSQAQVGDLVGRSHVHVGNIERGRRGAVSTLLAIAKVLEQEGETNESDIS